MDKKTIAFQLPLDLIQKLNEESKQLMISLSALLRIIILDHYNDKEDDNNDS